MSKEEHKQGSWGSGSNRDQVELVPSACPQWRLKYCLLEKNAQHGSLKLSFIWGQNEDCSLGDSTSDSCEKTVPKVGEKDSIYIYTMIRKGRGARDQIANIRWIIEKAREFQKKHLFLLYGLCQSL